MPRICQARIIKEFKSRKAESERPATLGGVLDYPICLGTITLRVHIEGGGCCQEEYCYCSWPEIQVNAKCSRCKNPYFDGIDALIAGDARPEIERILNE